jgi:hypothetical protein
MATNSTTPPVTKVILGCSKCGASLPDEAQFCLKCGKPVSSPPKSPVVVEALPPEIRVPRRPKTILLAIGAGALVAVFLWVGIRDSQSAQQVREFVGWNHDQIILDSSFPVGPHTFRYYKFALPEGSVNVALVGQFTSAADNSTVGSRQPNDRNKGKADTEVDNNIEVYVLTDSAFTVWQNGYATSSLYESGKVDAGNVQVDVPAGAGIYYLIFSNKSSPKTPKSIHASILLRYKSWLPDWFRRMKGRFWDWVGS